MKGMEVDNDDDDDDDENDLIGKYAGLMMMELMMICWKTWISYTIIMRVCYIL